MLHACLMVANRFESFTLPKSTSHMHMVPSVAPVHSKPSPCALAMRGGHARLGTQHTLVTSPVWP